MTGRQISKEGGFWCGMVPKGQRGMESDGEEKTAMQGSWMKR